MLFVDTNVFLEIILGQKNTLFSEKFFSLTAEKNIPLICSNYAIHSIESILSQKDKWQELEKFLEKIENSSNQSVYFTDIVQELEITKMAQAKKLDFDDAVQYFVAKKTDCEAIVSYDSHFDKTDLKRITPNEWLEKNKETKKA